MTSVSQILILAAGNGSRFRASASERGATDLAQQHKALAPIWDERGSLALVLGHLRALAWPASHIAVARGFQAERIGFHARQAYPDIAILEPHPEHAEQTMMQSLQHALSQLPARPTWVLFADTLYSREALSLLKGAGTFADPVVSACPLSTHLSASTKSACPLNVTLRVQQNRVLEFSSAAAQSTHEMAHAVYWPVKCLPLIKGAAPQLKQWHLLQHLPQVRALELPPGAAQDIDTIDDLEQLRPQITEHSLDYFAENLNKDRRSIEQPDCLQNGYYVKQCESVEAAAHEANVLRLFERHLPGHAPRLFKRKQYTLVIEAQRGMRFYDLLRQLDSQAPQRAILQQRCNQRLQQQQALLLAERANISSEPYPFHAQVTELLTVLCSLLRLPPPPLAELATLDQLWQQQCSVPFRDATPKNILLVEPRLCPTLAPQQRQQALHDLLHGPLEYWQNVPLLDLDFTSTKHLTSPADDVLSLNGHAVNFAAAHTDVAAAGKKCLPLKALADDLTLLVRYLRFGGRKLAYKLMNPTGFAVRFRYDEPCFYLNALVTQLSTEFQHDYPQVFGCLRALRDKAERWRGVQPSIQAPDYHLQRNENKCLPLNGAALYWQESPLELQRLQALQQAALRRPFRRSSADSATITDLQRKLNVALAQQQPIRFSVPFGGYKHPQLPHSPAPNKAEQFWLEYLRDYAAPLAALHQAGVEFALSYTSGVLSYINGISASDQQSYLSQLAVLLERASCPRIRFRLVDIAELLGGSEQALQAVQQRCQNLQQPSAAAVARAARNAEKVPAP